jgi:hypothetical protein
MEPEAVPNKRDLTISTARANLIVLFLWIPVILLQVTLYNLLHGTLRFELRLNFVVFIGVLIISVVLHELLHGIGWMIFGHKPLSAIKFGFQWQSFTPYAHLKEPVEVNAYRIGGFLPGLILGILPYLLSLLLGDVNLLLFGLLNTAGAGGDWLMLWLLRRVPKGALVEDHPTKVGCYVLEP